MNQLTIDTLRINMSHFNAELFGKSLHECSDHSSYDRFINFVSNEVFSQEDGRSFFVDDPKCRGFEAIISVLSESHNLKQDKTKSDEINDNVYLCKAALQLLGMLMSDQNFFMQYKDQVIDQYILSNLLSQPTNRNLHEQDKALLTVASLEAITLMLKHQYALTYLINEKNLLS
ncbi:hypothetical protein AKO1_005920, partial [Acrasis kona]